MKTVLAFDSGVGGLSVLAPLVKNYSLNIKYLGDLANLPYGTKSPKRIRELALEHAKTLCSSFAELSPRVCVVACNTVSAHALDVCQKVGRVQSIPVEGVLWASCWKARQLNPDRIFVLATRATVQSKSYTKTLYELGVRCEIAEIACPLFVPFVEEGILSGPAIEWVVSQYLPSRLQPSDCVILGCTHYPYLLPLLRSIHPEVQFVEAGQALLDAGVLKNLGEPEPNPRSHLEMFFTDTPPSSEKLSLFTEAMRPNLDQVSVMPLLGAFHQGP